MADDERDELLVVGPPEEVAYLFPDGEVLRCIGDGVSEESGSVAVSVLMDGTPRWLLETVVIEDCSQVRRLEHDVELWDLIETDGVAAYYENVQAPAVDERLFGMHVAVHTPGWSRSDFEQAMGFWQDVVLLSDLETSFGENHWSQPGRDAVSGHGVDPETATFWTVDARTDFDLVSVGRMLARANPNAVFLTDTHEAYGAAEVLHFLDQGWDLRSRRPAERFDTHD